MSESFARNETFHSERNFLINLQYFLNSIAFIVLKAKAFLSLF